MGSRARIEAELAEGLRKLGLEHRGARALRLLEFTDHVLRWNTRIRLIASSEDIVVRHLMDSLGALRIIRGLEPARIADVGSGAGFPGIPLAICMENTRVSLIERSGRRAGFLRNVVVSMGLANTSVIEKPVEEARSEGPFSLITLRAFAAVNRGLLETLVPFLRPGGVIAAYKGRRAAAEREAADAASQGNDAVIHDLSIPGLDEQRCLLLIRPV